MVIYIQKLNIIAVPDLWNFTKNPKSKILTEISFQSNTHHVDEVISVIRSFLIHNYHVPW